MRTVIVHAITSCVGGQCPTEARVHEMLTEIELYALRKGYKGVIEERYWWGTETEGDNFLFAVYRDYNVVAP